MKREFATLIALALALGSAPTAQAISRPWFGGSFGYGSYSMGEFNDWIELLDEVTGPRFKPVEDGIVMGADIGVYLTQRLALSLHYSRNRASTTLAERGSEIVLNVPANVYYASLDYELFSFQDAFFGIGASGGITQAAGDFQLKLPDDSRVIDTLSGSGGYADGRIFLVLPMGGYFAILPHIGYRYSTISTLTSNSGAVLRSRDGTIALDYSDVSLDYSGVFGGFAVRILFGSPPE